MRLQVGAADEPRAAVEVGRSDEAGEAHAGAAGEEALRRAPRRSLATGRAGLYLVLDAAAATLSENADDLSFLRAREAPHLHHLH